MGGINQIINIYSNINRMTDQQKGYGLGIILGIRLPRPRKARETFVARHDTRRASCVIRARASCTGTASHAASHALPPLSLSAYHLYLTYVT